MKGNLAIKGTQQVKHAQQQTQVVRGQEIDYQLDYSPGSPCAAGGAGAGPAGAGLVRRSNYPRQITHQVHHAQQQVQVRVHQGAAPPLLRHSAQQLQRVAKAPVGTCVQGKRGQHGAAQVRHQSARSVQGSRVGLEGFGQYGLAGEERCCD